MAFNFETERLVMTVPSMDDFDDLVALRCDPDVMRRTIDDSPQLGVGEVQTPEQVELHIMTSEDYFKESGFAFFCVRKKDDGELIGQAGLIHWCYQLEQSEIELAFRMHKRFWGHGYATELANALIDWGLNELNIPRIISPVHPDNQAPRHVLEKVGMVQEGQVNHAGHVLDCFVIYNPKNPEARGKPIQNPER